MNLNKAIMEHKPPPKPRAMPGLRALRFRFEYDKHGIRCTRIVPPLKVIPAPTSPAPKEGAAGLWFELRDEKNVLLFHLIRSSMLEFDREIHGRKPGGSPKRVPVPDAKGFLAVVLPDLPEARSLMVMCGPFEPGAGRKEAKAQLIMYREKNGSWKTDGHERK